MKTYMDKIRKEHPNFAKVLEMMCDEVNAPYSVVNDNSEDKQWFLKYAFTPYQEKEFEKKLFDFIWNSRDARREFDNLLKDKMLITRWIKSFLFRYGFTIKTQAKEKEEKND